MTSGAPRLSGVLLSHADPSHPVWPSELQSKLTGGERARTGRVRERPAAIFVLLHTYVNMKDVVKAARVRAWKHMTSSERQGCLFT